MVISAPHQQTKFPTETTIGFIIINPKSILDHLMKKKVEFDSKEGTSVGIKKIHET